MTQSFWWLLTASATTYRLALLVTRDEITAPLRHRLRTHPRFFELVHCSWCIGVWIAAGLTALVFYFPKPMSFVCFAGALAALAGFFSEHT